MIRLRPSGVDEILIKLVQDWYEPGPGVFITSTSTLFSPAMLFTGTTTGAWYDPSDTTTLFRDAAGTLPVTAVEQPVGRMLDKSGRGNHAFNPSGNSANFPVLSARYNLLTKTEDFSDAVWQKINSGSTNPSITSTGLSDALGGNTATRVVFGAITANSQYSVLKQDYFNASGSYTRSIYVKASTSGDVGKLLFIYSAVGDGITITLSNTWQRISGNASLSGTTQYAIATLGSDYGGGNQAAVSVDVCGADLRVANDALNQPAYQRVNTATDYDTVGFKPYLRFNDPARGTNNWLQTNSIDFTYGDKMFVSAGVRKLSDAAQGVIVELSTSAGANVGAILLDGPNTVATNYRFASRGSILSSAIATNYAAPITNVLSGIGNISGDQSILRINGEQAAISTADQGTGNYGNYPLYIGARAGTSLWANIRFYGAVVAGKQASADEITNTETFINQKTGAY